jgi:ribonuclease BN (tRNA processing enzyme)
MVVLGVGDAFSALHYSTNLALVAEDGRWLLVDCAHPIRKILREAAASSQVDLSLTNLVGVALTHLHADHVSGLEGLGYYHRFELSKIDGLPLFAGATVADQFRHRPEASCFAIQVLSEKRPTAVGPFRILARPVKHGNMAAYAFRFDCGGRSLGHSGDTVFDPDLIRWLAAADFVVHEAGTREIGSTFHTSYSELVALPEELRSKMHLSHYADNFDVFASHIEPLRQGWVYEV